MGFFAPRKGVKGNALAVFFLLFWCGITGTFDFLLIRGALRQWQALDYPTAEGEVVESRLVGSRKRRRAEIVTRFTVDGKTHETRQYRYDAWGGAGSEDVVARHRVGSRPLVHYQPGNPDDAILEAGLQGHDGFLLLFLTPFNLVGLYLLGEAAWTGWKHKHPPAAAAPAAEETIACIRPRPTEGWKHAFLVLFVGPILSALVLGISGLGFRSFWYPFGTLLVLVGIAGACVVRGHLRNKSGTHDFILDRIQRRVVLPASHGGLAIPFVRISAATTVSKTIERRKSTKTTWYLRLAADGAIHDLEFDLKSRASAAARRIRKAARLANKPG